MSLHLESQVMFLLKQTFVSKQVGGLIGKATMGQNMCNLKNSFNILLLPRISTRAFMMLTYNWSSFLSSSYPISHIPVFFHEIFWNLVTFYPKRLDYFHLDTLVETLTHDYPEG